MKNPYTIIFGLVGLVLNFLLVIAVYCAPSLNPVFVMWVGVIGALVSGELILIGLKK